MKKMKIVILLCLVFALVVPALAQSADDLYNRAVNKYFLGDAKAAVSLLKQALEADPGHGKSRALLAEIQKELGEAAPAVTTTVRRAPPPTARPLPRITRPKAAPPPKFVPKLMGPVAVPKSTGMESTINQIVMLLVAAIIIGLALAARGVYFIVRDYTREMRKQVCPDCKLRNPEEAEFCQACGTRLKVWSEVTTGQKKWFAKFGWRSNPFALTVIPSLFTGYSAQVKSIMEKLGTRSGHILVYGDKGVGKTTLLRWLADNLNRENHAIYVARPPINFDDLIRLVVSALRGSSRKKYSLYEVEELVKKAKKPVVLLIDEAHEVTPEIEQQMRSVGDIQGVNLVLAGLPETREKIKRDSPPLFDRIILESYIEHLSLEETRDLIKKRIESVGGQEIKPFTNEAIENIFKMSKGRPRMILKVCDWVMTDAIRNNLEVIGAEAGKDFPHGEAGAKPEEQKT